MREAHAPEPKSIARLTMSRNAATAFISAIYDRHREPRCHDRCLALYIHGARRSVVVEMV